VSDRSFDQERAKRYKKWWAQQRGAPRGELIRVPLESWQKVQSEPMEASGGQKG